MHEDGDSGVKGRGLQISLAALLLLVTAICVALVIWRSTRREVTTAFLEIRYPPVPTLSTQEIQRRASTQLALFRSSAVVTAALQTPQVRQLASVARQSNPEVWLLGRLQASFASDSPILELRFEGERGTGAEDAEILSAWIDAQQKAAASAAAGGVPEATLKIIQRPVVSAR